MTDLRLRAIAASLLAASALSACATQDRHAGPSPRPQCASFTAPLYFESDSANLLPTATPLLHDLADRIAACRAAGGALSQITVTAYPDRSGGREEARSEIDARARAARAGLMAVGIDSSDIVIRRHTDPDPQVMQRRAEIAIEMW